jgi:hypothetical protein
MVKTFKLKIFFSFVFLFVLISGSFFSFQVKAQTDSELFNINSYYDFYDRKEVEATLVRSTNRLYFYIETGWWESRSSQEQNSIKISLFELSEEFQNKIYPLLTSTFGSEPKPGIDNDERITVLIHQMTKEMGGYFDSGNLYEKIQYPKSNEREMVYLNSYYIDQPNVKSYLAHEFVHLITANQKNLLRKVNEEVWLNEARAEYASTLLGYDDVYSGSNLEKRVNEFLNKPSASLTEWLNRREDYGAVNLFTQYLVDHYGVKILVDSLKSNKTGIESLNYALLKNNYNKDFSQIFADWLITVLVNNCDFGKNYCYLNKHLKDLRVTPSFYYLPKTETVLSTYHNTGYWMANWHRFIGGSQNLVLEFNGSNSVEFKIPYLLCDYNNNCSVNYLFLDKNQEGKISFSQFNEKYSSLTIMPFIKNKTAGFNGREDYFAFSWQISIQEESTNNEEELIKKLLSQIEELKSQINQYQAKINAILGGQTGQISCSVFNNNLFLGMRNNQEVRCLQEFLKNQGPDIYPEGLVTGNFLSLTKQAVIRFQEKYNQEILAPLGLSKGTGYFGSATRAKINQIINSQ